MMNTVYTYIEFAYGVWWHNDSALNDYIVDDFGALVLRTTEQFMVAFDISLQEGRA
jgi:hypothetical protein